MSKSVSFGNVDKERVARVKPASKCEHALWRPTKQDKKNIPHIRQRDKRVVRIESIHPPEVLQVARDLGINPKHLHEELKLRRKIMQLEKLILNK